MHATAGGEPHAALASALETRYQRGGVLLLLHTLYRYWDATSVVQFALEMAKQALEKDLREETEFLERFDQVYREIDQHFDVRCNELTTLVVSALQNNGKVSKHRRKQYRLTVPDAVFDAIERACEQARLNE